MSQSQEKLVQAFEELFSIEQKAHDYYEKLLTENQTEHQKEVISRIHDDEEKHMKIVEEIISLVGGSK